MGYLKYVRDLWKKPKQNLGDIYKQKLVSFRKEPVTIRLDQPTRPDRARAVGYRAKQGIIVVRQKVTRGGRQRPQIKHGRRPKANTRRKTVSLNYQTVAEQRANKHYPNCEVAGSYLVAKDGSSAWYEIVLYDRDHPQIKADKRTSWAFKTKGKVYRGLTSSGKKSRGLRGKGNGYEKIRPSRSSHYGKNKK